MSAEVIDGKRISQAVLVEVAGQVKALKRHGVTPGLAAVLVGEHPASEFYVRNKRRASDEAGIRSETVRLPAGASEDEVLAVVDRLNADPAFHGLIVQLPLPPQVRPARVIQHVSPDKDVDGFHPLNLGRLALGDPLFIPATPYGVQQLLLRSGHSPEGKHVVVCGRSDTVGKPLALLLMQKRPGANATVTVCHTGTRDLRSITRTADILVVAMGVSRCITADMVRPGAVVIDVGINRVADPSAKAGARVVGDVDYEGVSKVASAITPVPGGVGPMTVAMLLVNVVKAAERSLGR